MATESTGSGVVDILIQRGAITREKLAMVSSQESGPIEKRLVQSQLVSQDDMTLACEYTINPTMPVNDSDYLPGGPLHDNAILFAALAYAEQIATKAAGPHTAQYNKLLASSIDRDAEVADTNLGYSCNGAGTPTLGEMYIEAERNAPWSYLGLP